MKKRIFALAAILALSMPCFGQEHKIMTTPKISLNFNTKSQRTITYKNEIEGIKDLRELAMTSKYEQGFIFSPNKEKPDSSTWENITSKMSKCGKIFEIDTLQLEKIMEKNNKIVDYHFHLFSEIVGDTLEISKKAKRSLIKLSKRDSSIDYRFLFKEGLKNKFAEMAMPSLTDLVYMIDNTVKYSQINNLGEISFKLCSPLGMTEYNLTLKGKEIFKKYGRGQWYLDKGQNNQDNSLFIKIYNQDINAVQTAKLFAEQISDSLFSVNFKSWEEIYNSP